MYVEVCFAVHESVIYISTIILGSFKFPFFHMKWPVRHIMIYMDMDMDMDRYCIYNLQYEYFQFDWERAYDIDS